jgi:hypothetical protein
MENENKLETTSEEILTEAVDVPTPVSEVSEEATTNPDFDTVDFQNKKHLLLKI